MKITRPPNLCPAYSDSSAPSTLFPEQERNRLASPARRATLAGVPDLDFRWKPPPIGPWLSENVRIMSVVFTFVDHYSDKAWHNLNWMFNAMDVTQWGIFSLVMVTLGFIAIKFR